MPQDTLKITIYGDSIMKGTIIDERCRYHTTMDAPIRAFAEDFGAEVLNRSRFGFTSERGMEVLERDISRGLNGGYALVGYGGNDCNYNWDEVAAHPEAAHEPTTALTRFMEVLQDMIKALKDAEITPVLMTLPPIDSDRFLRFVSRENGGQARILKWMGDVEHIYRHHEKYSKAIAEVAARTGALLADVRGRFLEKSRFDRLIGMDGMHLNAEGYALVCDALRDFAAKLRSNRPVLKMA